MIRSRFEDTPELFGNGIGHSTVGPIICEWCGNNYNLDNIDSDGDIINPHIDSICITEFAGKEICDCCFKKIEDEIFRRISDIIPWYKRILEHHKRRINKHYKMLKEKARPFKVPWYKRIIRIKNNFIQLMR